jgi:hypothetical protein
MVVEHTLTGQTELTGYIVALCYNSQHVECKNIQDIHVSTFKGSTLAMLSHFLSKPTRGEDLEQKPRTY